MAAVLTRTAFREGGLANWPGSPRPQLAGTEGRIRLQWCTGAPGVLAGAWEYLDEELLLAAAELIWRADAHGDEKGHGICHGTSGNGFALLKAFARTGDERRLERARRFAVHALGQVERLPPRTAVAGTRSGRATSAPPSSPRYASTSTRDTRSLTWSSGGRRIRSRLYCMGERSGSWPRSGLTALPARPGLALMTVALALVALTGGARHAGSSPDLSRYVNPTPGRDIALQIPGMHRAAVRRNLVYAPDLTMDVYRPRGVNRRLPAVLFVHGSGGQALKDAGVFVGWGQLAAATGLAGVTFNHYGVQADIQTAIRYVRRNARRLLIDGDRLCVAGYSAGVLPSMLIALKGGAKLRCAVAYYGPLDAYHAQSSPLTYLRASSLPVLVVKAGRDVASINESIDRFVAKGRRLGAPVELLVHASGGHGFDAYRPNARAAAIIRRTLAFVRAELRR
jgi:dienelactone hydrolase